MRSTLLLSGKTKKMKYIIISLLLFCSLFTVSATTIIPNKEKDTTIISNNNITYKVAQDDTNLYINISTSDTKAIMSILHFGVTVFFDIKGKKKQTVYVKYPLEPIKPNMKKGVNLNDDFPTLEDENRIKLSIINTIENELPQEAEYRYFDAKDTFHILLNTQDISLSYNYNIANGLLEYNLKIPKNKINADSKKDLSKLMIGVKTNSIELKQINNGKPSVNIGGIGFGGQGGRQGGSPGGGQGGQRNGSPAAEKNAKPKEAILDFWFKADL